MITQIKGRLIEKSPTELVIDCNGVGYSINISLNTYSQIGDDENIKLFTHLIIKEDSHSLYGFFKKSERSLFKLLISVFKIFKLNSRCKITIAGLLISWDVKPKWTKDFKFSKFSSSNFIRIKYSTAFTSWLISFSIFLVKKVW